MAEPPAVVIDGAARDKRVRWWSLRRPIAALGTLGALIGAVWWIQLPPPDSVGPSFGAANFYAFYSDPDAPQKVRIVNASVWTWAGNSHSRPLRVEVRWENYALDHLTSDMYPVPAAADPVTRAALALKTDRPFVQTNAEAETLVQHMVVQAHRRGGETELSALLARHLTPQRNLLIRVFRQDRAWLDWLESARGPALYVLAVGAAAALVWIGVRAAALIRSARLARIGRCTACGYSLAGLAHSARCPECGMGADR